MNVEQRKWRQIRISAVSVSALHPWRRCLGGPLKLCAHPRRPQTGPRSSITTGTCKTYLSSRSMCPLVRTLPNWCRPQKSDAGGVTCAELTLLGWVVSGPITAGSVSTNRIPQARVSAVRKTPAKCCACFRKLTPPGFRVRPSPRHWNLLLVDSGYEMAFL